jgi:hypothetical protein
MTPDQPLTRLELSSMHTEAPTNTYSVVEPPTALWRRYARTRAGIGQSPPHLNALERSTP